MVRKKTLIIVGLILLGIYFFAGINRFGAFDYDEAIYSSVAGEMIATNQFLIPKYNGKNFLEKPPLFYWLIVLVQKIFRFSDIAISGRIVSILATIGTIFLIYHFSSRLFDATTGLFSALVFTFCLGTIIISRTILLDALLNFFLSLTLLTALASLTGRARSIYLIYLAAGLATLTKGPIGILLPALVIIIFWIIYRKKFTLKTLKLPTGILLYLALTLPIFLLLNQATAGHFWSEFFLTQNLARFSRHAFEGHSGPWFYYLLLIFFLLFPASAFLPAAFRHLGNKKSPENTFFLVWFLTTLIIFSASRTKLPNYIIPAITPLAIILGIYLKDLWLGNAPYWRRTSAVIYLITAIALIGVFLLLGPIANIYRPQLQNRQAFLLAGLNFGLAPLFIAIIFAGGLLLFLILAAKKLFRQLFFTQILLMFLVDLTLINLFIPSLYRIFQADLRQIAEEIRQESENEPVLAVGLGMNPSLVLYSKRKVFFVAENEIPEIARRIKQNNSRLLVIAPKNIATNLLARNVRLLKNYGGYSLLLWSI